MGFREKIMTREIVGNKYLDTFRTALLKRNVKSVSSVIDLIDIYMVYQKHKSDIPTSPLIVGGGSNLLFVGNYSGPVILNQIKGIQIEEDLDAWYLHVGSGESWHKLVSFTIQKGIFGMENLALIPGTVGAAPIQNIGAYGVEFKEFCDYVEVLDSDTLMLKRLCKDECQFGYRDSTFKQPQNKKLIITGVGFRISKEWKPVLSYGELSKLDPTRVTAQQIYELVIKTRKEKLPDPEHIGNAGSFFKNPIVTKEKLEFLSQKYPDMPFYPIDEKAGYDFVKLAAGWLIDKCELKGFELNGAKVHEKQALVLINANNATGKDIALLAKIVQSSVQDKFGVLLEPEVRFIGKLGEVNALKYLSKISYQND
ncbi:UDP-N-acetylmuramate dehydrogenase [Thorsellia anophelis DSM 18579]|uniref:UDP-N-acetylenolpyruvoylglucosamine reductase n=2 Tax=Thorsellia anophelis TaxID=336804 RepID=A0A1I0F2W7_9GAMM|nr:UDP-N-acetylmuramate dehydrogenase [Thorsellia anophelis DSM 18579]